MIIVLEFNGETTVTENKAILIGDEVKFFCNVAKGSIIVPEKFKFQFGSDYYPILWRSLSYEPYKGTLSGSFLSYMNFSAQHIENTLKAFSPNSVVDRVYIERKKWGNPGLENNIEAPNIISEAARGTTEAISKAFDGVAQATSIRKEILIAIGILLIIVALILIIKR